MLGKALRTVVLLGLLGLGCQPAHINPLDPESDHYLPPPPVDAPASFAARVRSVHTFVNANVQAFAVAAETWALGGKVIDSAWVEYPGRSRVALRPTGNGVWTVRLAGSYFGDPHLGSVIGQPFRMLLHTADDSTFERSPLYLFRVIDTAPVLLEPDSQDVVTAIPVLSWAPYTADFPYHFLVSVVQPVDPPYYETEVWNSGWLADTTRAVAVETGLDPGGYYWTVSAVDTFENTARSVAGSFVVTAGSTP